VLLDQCRIDCIPLGLEELPQDGSAGGGGQGFQFVEGGLGLEVRDVGLGEIKGREFGHGLARWIVHPAN